MTVEQISAFTGLGTMIGLIAVGILNRLDARKAEKVANQIHTLVNSQMGIQLRINMLQAREIVSMTTDPARKKVAVEVEKEATRLYEEHQKKQALIDAETLKKV